MVAVMLTWDAVLLKGAILSLLIARLWMEGGVQGFALTRIEPSTGGRMKQPFVATPRSCFSPTNKRTTTTRRPEAPPRNSGCHFMSSDDSSSVAAITAGAGEVTDLPDSLDHAAEIAAQSTAAFAKSVGLNARSRVDFDTSAGDETYTILKSSTEFMQKFTSGLCYSLIDGLMEWRQRQMMKVATARAELQELMLQEEPSEGEEEQDQREKRIEELKETIVNGGFDEPWKGDMVRIYFPDEGSAALARRDWKLSGGGGAEALVPDCVDFSSLGGIQTSDTSRDVVVLFFCPKASEAKFAEEELYRCEDSGKLKLAVFVNPNLVDMGVTGFGTAGRMLRERLIDGLTYTYYLRTLQWGALTRSWPRDYTIWQEDEGAEGGYRMIKRLDFLPSNPDVEDIYDIENGMQNAPQDGFGLLNALGDFVNGMTKL